MSPVDWILGRDFMPTIECLHHDWWVIGSTIALCLAVIIGYLIIAMNWNRQRKKLRHDSLGDAPAEMMWIFLLCGVCGYLFTIIRMFWPLWRPNIAVLCVLVYYTYKYAFFSTEKTTEVFDGYTRGQAQEHRIRQVAMNAEPVELESQKLLSMIRSALDRTAMTIDEVDHKL